MATINDIRATIAILGSVVLGELESACNSATTRELEKARRLVTHGDDFTGIMDGPEMMPIEEDR